MSVKSIVVKIFAGCIVVGILLGTLYFLSAPEKTTEAESFMVLSANEKEVTGVCVYSDTDFVLNLSEGIWEMESMEGIKVNNAYANALVKSLSNLSSPMPAEENPEDFSLYGLDKPCVEIKLLYKNGEETIKIGNESGNYRYVTVGDTGNVYVVSTQDLYMAFLDKMSYLDTTAFSADANAVDYIEIGKLILVKNGDEWQEEKPYNVLTDTNAVKAKVVEAVCDIQSVDIVEKAHFGTSNSVNVVVGRGDEKQKFYLTRDDGQYYLCFDKSNYAYVVEEEEVSFLSVTGFELLIKYVAPISISEVEKIEFVSPKETVVLTIEAPSTEAPLFYKNGRQVTEESFRSFYQILMGLTFSGEGKSRGEAEYSITFTKESGDMVTVEFIPSENNEYGVAINGETNFTIYKKHVSDVFGYLKNIIEV